jgi:hypothetical protein
MSSLRLNLVRLDDETAAYCCLCGRGGGHRHLDRDLRQFPGSHGIICDPCTEVLKTAECELLATEGICQPLVNTPNL